MVNGQYRDLFIPHTWILLFTTHHFTAHICNIIVLTDRCRNYYLAQLLPETY